MFRIIFFASLGLILGGIIVVITTGPFTSIWPITVGSSVALFSGVFWFAGRIITSGSTPPVHATTHAARVAGRLGVARIDASKHDGTKINYQPQMEFEVTVQPRHGNAYRTSVLKVVPVGDVHKFEAGSLHNVVILAEGQPDIALIDATPKDDLIGAVHVPEKEMAGKVLRRSPYSLRPDGTRRRPIIGTDPKSRPARIAVYVIAFLVAVGAVIYPYQAAIAQTFTSLQSGKLRADLREPEPLEQAIDALNGAITLQ